METVALVLGVVAVHTGAACSPVTHANVDYTGGDLPGQPASKTLSSAAECAALCCAAQPACDAFSLNAGAPGGRWCYLKGSTGYSQGPSSGCDSGCLRGDCDAPPPPPPDTYFPWFDLTIPRATRVALLVANMTQAEAIHWLNDGVPAIPRLGLPSYSWEAEALHGVSWNGVATVFPQNIAWGATWDVPLVSRIADTIALEARAKWVSGMGADGSSSEFAGLSFMTPNNNLFIDPLWGRGQETYGEDPVLTSALTYALVTGLQFGADPTYTRMISTTKHFLGYHLESWAGDGQYRLSHSFNYSETDIQQVYMAPFRAALAANVTAAMCAYDGANGTNPAWPHPLGPEPWGVPMCAHPDMQRLLRTGTEWAGYVISDEGAISFMTRSNHHYTDTLVDAACLAFNAGTDLALGGEYASTLATCLQQGNVTDARLREALTRVLTAHADLGWLDTVASIRSQATAAPFADPVSYNANVGDANVSTPASRALSHTVALESLVLLSNRHSSALPLAAAGVKKLALVGPAAAWSGTATGSYLGNYAGCEEGPGGAHSPDARCHVVTLLEALTQRSATGGWALAYAQGCDVNTAAARDGFAAAIAAAAGADVIVAAMGLDTCQESRCSEGEANDRGVSGGQFPAAGLELGGAQLPLLQALRAAYPSTPLVVVLLNGGPISSPWTLANADAVLESWYPGYEGGAAIAAALFGDAGASPAGRMPVTTVASLADLPPHTDFVLSTPPGRTHLYFTGQPLTPFGFGLSYANFSYEGLAITPPALAPTDAAFTVSARVTHAGGPDSDEVAQLYGHFRAPSVGAASVPLQQLLAFERLHALHAGNSAAVSFTLQRDALALVAPEGGPRRVQPGTWTLWLGGGPPSNAEYGGGAVLVGSLLVQ